jgi:hypothetical protein
MFMTDSSGLIFPWQVDERCSDSDYEVAIIPTSKGDLVRRVARRLGQWGDDESFPIQTEADHKKFVLICEWVDDHESLTQSSAEVSRPLLQGGGLDV